MKRKENVLEVVVETEIERKHVLVLLRNLIVHNDLITSYLRKIKLIKTLKSNYFFSVSVYIYFFFFFFGYENKHFFLFLLLVKSIKFMFLSYIGISLIFDKNVNTILLPIPFVMLDIGSVLFNYVMNLFQDRNLG